MRSVHLVFKRIGNHWYLDIPHHNPNDLVLDRRAELFLSRLDEYNEGIIDRIWLHEQNMYIINEGLLQINDKDLMRYFTTDDDFRMHIYISGHKFTISSRLYALLELNYKLDMHESVYRIAIDEI